VLVVRPHPGVVDTLPAADGTSVVDASWYADTADLLLAADVVVTDTSSLLWDGVLTGRPIVVFLPGDTAGQERPGRRYLAPDSLPGPVITEEEDLVAAIRSAPDSAPGPAYRAMQDALAPLADGEATSRVVDLMTALVDGGPA
jgi:CDP-glycerol glycerophosphotransferase